MRDLLVAKGRCDNRASPYHPSARIAIKIGTK
jgi:hypothetical protein